MSTDTAAPTPDDLTAKTPWYVAGARTRHNAMPVLQIVSEPTGEVLALVPYSDRTPKFHAECYADARLIAAAPDMLLALKAFVYANREMQDYQLVEEEAVARALAVAAISKATGAGQ